MDRRLVFDRCVRSALLVASSALLLLSMDSSRPVDPIRPVRTGASHTRAVARQTHVRAVGRAATLLADYDDDRHEVGSTLPAPGEPTADDGAGLPALFDPPAWTESLKSVYVGLCRRVPLSTAGRYRLPDGRGPPLA